MYRTKGCTAVVLSIPGKSTNSLPTVLLELPISIVQWADLTGLQPSRYTMEVESMLREEDMLVFGNSKADMDKGLTLQIPHATVHSSVVWEP